MHPRKVNTAHQKELKFIKIAERERERERPGTPWELSDTRGIKSSRGNTFLEFQHRSLPGKKKKKNRIKFKQFSVAFSQTHTQQTERKRENPTFCCPQAIRAIEYSNGTDQEKGIGNREKVRDIFENPWERFNNLRKTKVCFGFEVLYNFIF